jgi:hypothetical protein
MANGKFKDLTRAPHGEGIITMTAETQRGRVLGGASLVAQDPLFGPAVLSLEKPQG